MAVDSLHPEYIYRLPDWIKCRDAYNGQRAIKEGGVKYLPKLEGQTNAEYNAYKERALFYSITHKTVSALIGMAMAKPPELKYPEKLKSFFEDKSGVQFFELFANSLSETLLTARYGILVDRPVGGGSTMTVTYTAENILNWQVDPEGNATRVILAEEYYEADDDDAYTTVCKRRYRELYIDADGYYAQLVHNLDSKGKLMAAEMYEPVNTGVRMKYIPFVVINPAGVGFDDCKSPMLDIVDINISHYRTSADLEHGRHFTGLPTPWVTGVAETTVLKVGSMTAWVIPDHQAKVGYLEFTGQGLQSLEKALQEKQSQLASLSARLIDNSSRGSEASETVRLRYLSETASLRSVVRSVEAGLNQVYQYAADMESQEQASVSIKLNKNFLDERMNGPMLEALVDAYLKGGISKEMLLFNLNRGDVLPEPGSNPGDLPPRVNPNDPPETVVKPVAKPPNNKNPE